MSPLQLTLEIPTMFTGAPPLLYLSLHPDFTLHMQTKSLIGSRAKLQDIPKVEQLVIARLRGYIVDKVVWPRKWAVRLPAVGHSAADMEEYVWINETEFEPVHDDGGDDGVDDPNPVRQSILMDTGATAMPIFPVSPLYRAAYSYSSSAAEDEQSVPEHPPPQFSTPRRDRTTPGAWTNQSPLSQPQLGMRHRPAAPSAASGGVRNDVSFSGFRNAGSTMTT